MLSVRLMFANGWRAQSCAGARRRLRARDVDVRDVAQHLAAALRLPARARAIGAVEVRQALQELVDRRLRERGAARGSRPAMSRELEVEPRLARKDHGFARDVHARQVVARVGLGVPARLRLAHDLGERALAVEAD